ncbi:hypothetical protein BaRGS_00009494 [Batillaria attramentaria]|uniref:Uncharacterized protein n=1 Tax=Batillaria attramentaria TaxID=370345 RepID=A0ABD0LI68_9CAEN
MQATGADTRYRNCSGGVGAVSEESVDGLWWFLLMDHVQLYRTTAYAMYSSERIFYTLKTTYSPVSEARPEEPAV